MRCLNSLMWPTGPPRTWLLPFSSVSLIHLLSPILTLTNSQKVILYTFMPLHMLSPLPANAFSSKFHFMPLKIPKYHLTWNYFWPMLPPDLLGKSKSPLSCICKSFFTIAHILLYGNYSVLISNSPCLCHPFSLIFLGVIYLFSG